MSENKKNVKIYHNRSFFTDDFPFSFLRMHHTTGNYNENTLHKREFWKIIYIVSGRGQKIINEICYPLKSGGMFLIHPDDQTTFIIESKEIEICNILFMPELIQDGLANLKDDFSFFSILQRNFGYEGQRREQLYILNTDSNINRLVKCMEHEYSRKLANYQSLIRFNLLELLIRLCRKADNVIKQERQEDFVAYVDHVIDNYFQSNFSLDFLAEKLNVSKSHLCRVYRTRKNSTIMDNLRNRRLQEAKRLLSSEMERSISDICYACGFNDLSYFYRSFSASFGKNPGDYRRSFGQD